MCVWNICFMNYKYHLRFLGSTSSDRQDTQVPLVACFTITYRIQQQMDHRATPAAPDLRKAWAKKGTRHRSTKTMRGWGWNSVILYESTMSMGVTGFILRHLLEMWDAHLWWSVLLCVSQHLQKSITNLWVNYPNSIHRTLGRFFWKASSGVVATSQSWTAPDNQILGDLCCCNTLRMMLVAWLPCHSNRLKPNKPQISQIQGASRFSGTPKFCSSKVPSKAWDLLEVPWSPSSLKSSTEIDGWSSDLVKKSAGLDGSDGYKVTKKDRCRVYPYHIYTYVYVYVYIYILVGGFNPSEIISKLGWLFRSKPPTSYGWHVFHHPFPFS